MNARCNASEHNDIHDSLTIKFKPFDDNYNDVYLSEEE